VAEECAGENHGDMQLVDVERSGQLRADEPTADDHGGFPLCGYAPCAQIIVQAAEVTDAFEIAAGDVQRPRLAARCQQQFSIAVGLAIGGGYGFFAGIEPRRFCPQRQGNGMCIVERAVMEKDVLHFVFTKPQLLGQRRPVIWQVTFLAGQKYAARRNKLAYALHCRCARQPPAHYHVVVNVFHVTSLHGTTMLPANFGRAVCTSSYCEILPLIAKSYVAFSVMNDLVKGKDVSFLILHSEKCKFHLSEPWCIDYNKVHLAAVPRAAIRLSVLLAVI